MTQAKKKSLLVIAAASVVTFGLYQNFSRGNPVVNRSDSFNQEATIYHRVKVADGQTTHQFQIGATFNCVVLNAKSVDRCVKAARNRVISQVFSLCEEHKLNAGESVFGIYSSVSGKVGTDGTAVSAGARINCTK